MRTANADKPGRSEKRHQTPPRGEGIPADQRDTVHANWGRFLHANPKHRLTDGGPNRLCLIRHMSQKKPGACRRPMCPGCTHDALMRRLLDHQERWECIVNGQWRPAIAAHPYTVREGLIENLQEMLDRLGDAGADVRAYVSPSEDGWYLPPRAVTFLLQPAGAAAIHGWTEVRGTGEHGHGSDEGSGR